MRCIMEAPYFFAEPRASTALFTVDAARSGLAGRTGRAAGDRHVARAEQADIGLAGRVRLDIARAGHRHVEIGRAPCRESVCKYVEISGVAVSFTKNKSIMY